MWPNPLAAKLTNRFLLNDQLHNPMLKRTKGRLLLSLLVITGLAGKINDSSLTKLERKQVVAEYKDSRSDLMSAIKGLSNEQLNFKAAPEKWSIKECVYHITLAEEGLWSLLEQNMKTAAAPEKRSEIKVTDADILANIVNRTQKFQAPENFQPASAPWKSLDAALDHFKSIRAKHLKYARTTTEDLRNHVIDLPFGKVDAYQFLLFIAGHSRRHTQQILEIKQAQGFPSK